MQWCPVIDIPVIDIPVLFVSPLFTQIMHHMEVATHFCHFHRCPAEKILRPW